MKKSFRLPIMLGLIFLLFRVISVQASGWGPPVKTGNWQLTYGYNYKTHICYGNYFLPSSSGANPACDSYALDFMPLGNNKQVISVGSGTVVIKKWQKIFGNTVLINHGNGIYSRYAHLESFDPSLKEGGSVRQGTLIGIAGKTGGDFGVHLHFAMYWVSNGKAYAYKPEPLGGLTGFPTGKYAGARLSSNGTMLTCYSNCGSITQSRILSRVQISGNSSINENSCQSYTAHAYYSDGRFQNVTQKAEWSSSHGTISNGTLCVTEVSRNTSMRLHVFYMADSNHYKSADLWITIHNSNGSTTSLSTAQLVESVFDVLEKYYSSYFPPHQTTTIRWDNNYYRSYSNGSWLYLYQGSLWYNIYNTGWQNSGWTIQQWYDALH